MQKLSFFQTDLSSESLGSSCLYCSSLGLHRKMPLSLTFCGSWGLSSIHSSHFMYGAIFRALKLVYSGKISVVLIHVKNEINASQEAPFGYLISAILVNKPTADQDSLFLITHLFIDLFIFSVCVYILMCDSTYMEIREWFSDVSSFLSPCGS